MLLVAGLGMLAAAAIDPRAAPLAYSLAWGGVLLLVAWMALLAVGDAVASRVQAERELRHERQAFTALEAEARRLQAAQGNGAAPRDAGPLGGPR
jgi:type II secretory pathway component PulM